MYLNFRSSGETVQSLVNSLKHIWPHRFNFTIGICGGIKGKKAWKNLRDTCIDTAGKFERGMQNKSESQVASCRF